MFFSERKELVDRYNEWLNEHDGAKDCVFNVITFLSENGYLADKEKDKHIAELKAENENLQNQLKNAILEKIYFIGGKHYLSDEEIKNKDFLEVKELDVVDILNDCISKKGGFIDLVFDTKEEAEQKLKELKGDNTNA